MYWYSYWANYAILYQTMQGKYTQKALVRSIHRLVNRMVLLWNPNVAFDHAVCYRIHSAYVCVSQICRLVSLIQTNPTNKTFLAIIFFLIHLNMPQCLYTQWKLLKYPCIFLKDYCRS